MGILPCRQHCWYGSVEPVFQKVNAMRRKIITIALAALMAASAGISAKAEAIPIQTSCNDYAYVSAGRAGFSFSKENGLSK
jgi:hypothetical protein